MTKLKTKIKTKPRTSNCYKTQKLIVLQNSKTKIVTKLKEQQNSNSNQTQITAELFFNHMTTKLKNLNSDKTQVLTKLRF